MLESKPFNPLPIPQNKMPVPQNKMRGTIALYQTSLKNRLMLQLKLPSSLNAIGKKYRIEKTGPADWELTPSNEGLTVTKRGELYVYQEHAFHGHEPFGSSPADFFLIDGHVLVHLLEKKPISFHHKVRPPATPNNPNKITTPSNDILLEALRTIVQIESTTPYRLTKAEETGRWGWSAPRIELPSGDEK